jgi:hypothetical protein
MSRQYYFAFGSNMWLQQMAERCPGSTFVGRATLPGYRWQINERHVANIVKVDDEHTTDAVEGLVFSITEKDRRTLDRKEGIKLGVYERVDVVVNLHRHAWFANKKTGFVLAKLDDENLEGREKASAPSEKRDDKLDDNADQKAPRTLPTTGGESQAGLAGVKPEATEASVAPVVSPSTQDPRVHPPQRSGKPTNAITYLSTKFNDDGLIRFEYVQRMENAMYDAARLGVSNDFLQRCLEPYVHGEICTPDQQDQKPKQAGTTGPDNQDQSCLTDNQEAQAKRLPKLKNQEGSRKALLASSERRQGVGSKVSSTDAQVDGEVKK